MKTITPDEFIFAYSISPVVCSMYDKDISLLQAIYIRNELTKVINEHQAPIAASLSNSNASKIIKP